MNILCIHCQWRLLLSLPRVLDTLLNTVCLLLVIWGSCHACSYIWWNQKQLCWCSTTAGNRSRKMIVPEDPQWLSPNSWVKHLVQHPRVRTVTLDSDRHKKFVQLPDQAQFLCVKSTPKQILRKTHWSESFTRNVFHLSVVQFADCIPKIYRIWTYHSMFSTEDLGWI